MALAGIKSLPYHLLPLLISTLELFQSARSKQIGLRAISLCNYHPVKDKAFSFILNDTVAPTALNKPLYFSNCFIYISIVLLYMSLHHVGDCQTSANC